MPFCQNRKVEPKEASRVSTAWSTARILAMEQEKKNGLKMTVSHDERQKKLFKKWPSKKIFHLLFCPLSSICQVLKKKRKKWKIRWHSVKVSKMTVGTGSLEAFCWKCHTMCWNWAAYEVGDIKKPKNCAFCKVSFFSFKKALSKNRVKRTECRQSY